MENSVLSNRYRILSQIGSGGFGFTYLGEDLGFPNRPKCVIKLLRPHARDAASLTIAGNLFQQEAETLYRLGRHPNIPGLIAHFREQGEFYLVQEYIEGHTLDREFLGGRKYDQHDAIQLLGQILEILSFVHGEKVIHRDVKPANIIRRASDASLALIDFGAVKQLGPAAGDNSVAIGSHGYMPVEQLAGRPGFSSDLFALGLVVIEGLTGMKPLDIPKDPGTLEFQWDSRTALLPEMRHFISTLVRRDPRNRFFSAREALTNLNSIAARSGFFAGQRTASIGVSPIQGQRPASPQAEIPPTVIVSPQQRLVRPTVNDTPPQGSRIDDGNGRLARIGLGFGAIAMIFVVFHFAGIGSRGTRTGDPRPAVPKADAMATIQPASVDVYEEALDQVKEALRMENNATTRHEWEEISNKYRRAYLLFSSVGQNHPRFVDAQRSIEFYKKESERAKLKSREMPAG